MKEANGVGRAVGGFGIYEGQYRDGVPNGFGRMIFRNGNFYVGEFSEGKISGVGNYTTLSPAQKFEG